MICPASIESESTHDLRFLRNLGIKTQEMIENGTAAIEAHILTKRFGDAVAVESIRRLPLQSKIALSQYIAMQCVASAQPLPSSWQNNTDNSRTISVTWSPDAMQFLSLGLAFSLQSVSCRPIRYVSK